MIICPKCKEEIEDGSHFCDQCGQALLYCSSCGRVGIGRRCTQCGGQMVSPDEAARGRNPQMSYGVSHVSQSVGSVSIGNYSATSPSMRPFGSMASPGGIPMLAFYNSSLNIRFEGINGAVIGRRQGPYVQFFQQNMYVSGVHAQLKYKSGSGWCIADKHSSNGTKLNDRPIQPDVDMTLKNGDIVTIANINLQVSIN